MCGGAENSDYAKRCLARLRPDLWGAWAGNRPGLPDTHPVLI